MTSSHYMYGAGPSEADKPLLAELAVTAMKELVRMAKGEAPLWIRSTDNTVKYLSEDEYSHSFPGGIGPKDMRLKSEASKDSSVLRMDPIELVEIMMDVMTAEFLVPSSFVSTRDNYFVRYCKQHDSRTWAIADVSLDYLHPTYRFRCRRRPSGCLIEKWPHDTSKVTWVEHVEVEDTAVHNIYKPLVNSGLAFGAKRWVKTLERQCQRLKSAMENIPAGRYEEVIITPEGRKNMLKLTARMSLSFYTLVNVSTAQRWAKVILSGADDILMFSRRDTDDPGSPSGTSLSAATSFRIPVPPKKGFLFLQRR